MNADRVHLRMVWKRAMNLRSAVAKINGKGILLVYPIQNRPEPASLWSEFFPRSKMRWEWDDGADDRVARMWRLREAVSRSGQAVYAKWYQGRATFFSRAIFPYLLSALRGYEGQLSPGARSILRVLEEDSPLSTKELKRRGNLTGKAAEKTYERSLKELWSKLFIVGYGEIDDGAFPSLAMGATSLLFDDLWHEAQSLDPQAAEAELRRRLGADSHFYKQFLKNRGVSGTGGVQTLKGTLRYEDLVKK